MGKPPGHDDETRDDADPSARARGDDPDRAAILARRQRFIALALSGLATTACDKPNDEPSTPKGDKTVQEGKDDDQSAPPHACLKIAVPEDDQGGSSTGKPMPCLEVAMPDDEPEDAPPQACLKIAAPPPPEPKPHPCLSIRPPEPEPKPKPMPCLKVAPPKDDPTPQPCLRVAKPPPKGA